MSAPCEQSESIRKIREDLVEGRILFVKISNSLENLNSKVDAISDRQTLVIEQTTKTNGRVTKLELTKRAMWWIFIGMAGTFIVQAVGLKAAIVQFALGAK